MDLAGNNEVTLEEMLDARYLTRYLKHLRRGSEKSDRRSVTRLSRFIMKARSVKRPDMKLFLPPMLPLLS